MGEYTEGRTTAVFITYHFSISALTCTCWNLLLTSWTTSSTFTENSTPLSQGSVIHCKSGDSPLLDTRTPPAVWSPTAWVTSQGLLVVWCLWVGVATLGPTNAGRSLRPAFTPINPEQSAAATDLRGPILTNITGNFVTLLLNPNGVHARWNPENAGMYY